VLILKGVEVVCFDTLLQVLILKEMREPSKIDEIGSSGWRTKAGQDWKLRQRHRGTEQETDRAEVSGGPSKIGVSGRKKLGAVTPISRVFA